jgi:hypothetical protein
MVLKPVEDFDDASVTSWIAGLSGLSGEHQGVPGLERSRGRVKGAEEKQLLMLGGDSASTDRHEAAPPAC